MTQLTGNQIATPLNTPFFSSVISPAPPAVRGARAFFGEARNHGQQTDGSVTGGSWLQSVPATGITTPVIGWDYFEDTARVASVSNFGIGVTGASRNQGLDGIGIVGAVFADGATFKAWGAYIDAVRSHATAGSVSGIEVNAAQLPSQSPGNSGWVNFWHMGKTPYKAEVAGQVIGIGGSGGSDAAVFGRSYAVDAFLNIGQNGAAFWTGINFNFDAIMREGVADDRTSPGNSGYARAISFGAEQGLSWFSSAPSGAAGTQEEVLRFYAAYNDHTNRVSFAFTDGGMTYRKRGVSGHGIFTAVCPSATVTAQLRMTPGYTGTPDPVFEAHSESGGNANLVIRGAGTGIVVVDDPIKHKTFTVATLPAAASVGAGTRAAVTDANATTFNSIVATGGSNFVPVISDGTDWRIG